jgi:hypothetical protein
MAEFEQRRSGECLGLDLHSAPFRAAIAFLCLPILQHLHRSASSWRLAVVAVIIGCDVRSGPLNGSVELWPRSTQNFIQCCLAKFYSGRRLMDAYHRCAVSEI